MASVLGACFDVKRSLVNPFAVCKNLHFIPLSCLKFPSVSRQKNYDQAIWFYEGKPNVSANPLPETLSNCTEQTLRKQQEYDRCHNLINTVFHQQVYFKYVLKSPKLGPICLYMSSIGLFIILFGWVAPLILKITEIELWSIETVPWAWIAGCGGASLRKCLFWPSYLPGSDFSTRFFSTKTVTAVVVNCGISVASPFFISMYNLLRIPINNRKFTHCFDF